jgi:membrane protease YdiL (CAAX protease family)
VWWAVLGFVAGEVLGGILTVVVALAAGVSANHLNSSAPVLLAGEVGLWGGFVGACLLVSHRYGTGSLRADYGLAVRLGDVGFGLLAALSALVVEVIVAAAFAHTRFQGTNTQIITGQRHSGAGFAVVTIIVAVGAPFFEELFFRGLLRTAFKARMRPALAVLCQAVLFGLAHIQSGFGTGNLSIVVTITCVGLIFGLVAERTGRLGAGMIGHGLFNLTATLLILA